MYMNQACLKFSIYRLTLGDGYKKLSVQNVNVYYPYLMWFSQFEKPGTRVLDSHKTLSDILVKALEMDATWVDLIDLLDGGIGMLVISCENNFYVVL